MSKQTALALVLLLSIVISSTYAIVYDIISYRFCPEFYTKFKFVEYGVPMSTIKLSPWPLKAIVHVAFMASWWMGLIIGSILGFTALPLPSIKIMLTAILKAMGITVAITFITGLCGLAYGWYFLKGTRSEGLFYLPADVVRTHRFMMCMGMHNFSYVGAVLGMLASSIYIIRKKQKMMAF
jgi:hypothetical protein